LQFTDVGSADSLGTFIDDVSVICLGEEQECGNGQKEGQEECDGEDGATPGVNFCTHTCQLVPIYDGEHSCPGDLVPVQVGGPYEVFGNDVDGINISVTPGGKYLFEALGTFIPTGAPGYLSDAGYTLLNGSIASQYGIQGSGDDYAAHALLANLGSGVGVVDWGNYNPNHVYKKYYEPTVSSLQFLISDRYDNWFNTSWNNQSGMSDNSGNLTLNIYECQLQPVAIEAYKVVCDSEADLPNWGNHGSLIGPTTAQDYVDNSGGHCQLADGWSFQYGPAGSGSFDSFQTNTQVLGGSWVSFGPTVGGLATAIINDLSNFGGIIETREVFLSNDYVPFSNGSDVSAEFYCTGDVYNYDNWEWINNPQYGQTYYCVAFNALNYGSISGMKYEDVNGNNQQDAGELGLPNWTIELYDSPDAFKYSVQTDSNGSYSFNNLIPGVYKVCEVPQPGWTRTQPGSDCYFEVTVASGDEISGKDFGNFEQGEIIACKYDDYNDDGVKDEGEPGMNGITINLYQNIFRGEASDQEPPINGNSEEPVDSCETDETGCCTFDGLYLGSYNVEEDTEDPELAGYEPTSPTSVPVVLDTSGQEETVEFLNELKTITLRLNKTHDKMGTTASPGDSFNFTLTVTNDSDSTAYGVTVRDVLPDDFSYAGNAEVDGVPTAPAVSGQQLTWSLGDMAPGEVKIITYDVDLDDGLPVGEYPNVAVARGTNRPSGSEDNSTSYSNFAFVYTALGIGLSYSTSVGGLVLGAATEAGQVLGAATGSPTLFLIIALLMIMAGVALLNLERLKKLLARLNTKKLFRSFLIALGLLIFAAGVARAADNLIVKIGKLPEYINYDPFEIYYTALQVEGKPVEVKAFMNKDGQSKFEFGTSSQTSGSFNVDGSLLSGDGKYYFLVKATSDGVTVQSDEETVIIDRQAPGPVSDYRKEKVNSRKYKVCWKNPNEDDFKEVLIYRSDKTEFDANSSTLITRVGGAKNEEKCWENDVPDDKNYYYVTRVIDQAGNISGVVGDSEVTVTTTEQVAGAETSASPAPIALPVVSPAPSEEGQILGGETDETLPESGLIGGLGQTASETISRLGTWKTIGLVAVIGGLIGLVVYFFKKR